MQEETTKNNPSENQEVPQTENQINKTEEYLNNWKRAVADLANYKKEDWLINVPLYMLAEYLKNMVHVN